MGNIPSKDSSQKETPKKSGKTWIFLVKKTMKRKKRNRWLLIFTKKDSYCLQVKVLLFNTIVMYMN